MKLYLSRSALEHNRFLNYSWHIALVSSKEILVNDKQNLPVLDWNLIPMPIGEEG